MQRHGQCHVGEELRPIGCTGKRKADLRRRSRKGSLVRISPRLEKLMVLLLQLLKLLQLLQLLLVLLHHRVIWAQSAHPLPLLLHWELERARLQGARESGEGHEARPVGGGSHD